ncbi:MAG TPA: SLBB domain-containing protein [Chthonomonadaceae bacterium]|nr:SLBB domain-containing protein [Chthonomonadaceae bacterium]
MRTVPTRALGVAAAALSPLAIVGTAAILLSSASFAQELEKSRPPAAQPSAAQAPAAPARSQDGRQSTPLEIRTAQAGDDVSATSPLSHPFTDYRHPEGVAPKPNAKALPLFGYDIFQHARDLNDAQRSFITQQSLSQFGGTGRGSDRTDRETDRSDRSSRNSSSDGERRTGGGRTTADDGAIGAESASSNQDAGDGTSARRRNSGNGSSSTRDRDPFDSSSRFGQDDSDVQNGFATPIGPISLLYRAINASVPDNYTLGSGDVLRIRVQSPTFEEHDYRKIVDARGQIQLDPIGAVVLRGQTISSAEKLLESTLRGYIKDVQVTIETGLLRTMPILVTGAAYVPGTYTVPSTATAFNLLNIAGGPSDDGSLRAIDVMRQGKRIATLDIYKMISGDAKWTDVALAPGDVIIVQPRKSRVTIRGEVLRPAVFELLPQETLRDGLAYAGGIKPTGLNQSVRVNTVVPGAERVIRDLDVTGREIDRQALFDGDEVEVFSVRNRLNNRVTVEGAVDQPNDYQLMPGMHVADLVERARGPLSEAFLGKAELHRWQSDNTYELIVIDLGKALARDPKNNMELQKWDRLKVYTREEVAWTGRRTVIVDGAVKRPGTYDVSKNMHVSDLLRMAGGPTPDAEIESAHLFHHRDDGPDAHEYVNIAAAVKGDPGKDPEIMDSDRLIVLNVSQAAFTPDHRVDIQGEVVNPGRYPRFSGMKVSDLLAFAGGFKPSAGSQVVVAHARRVADTPTARLVTINFDRQGHCAAADDQPLEDGDVVSIQGIGGYQPEVQSFKVSGAVNRPGTIFLKSTSMRLSDAIREAGGLRQEAFPDGAEFLRDPQMLASTSQRGLVQSLSSLNDLMNDSEVARERAKASIELIKATGAAISDSAGLGSLSGGAAAIPNPAAFAGSTSFSGSQLVSPARKLAGSQLEPDRHVAVDLRAALARPGGPADIVLVDGDEIVVPTTPTTVSITGAVNSPRAVLYSPGKRLDYYIALAGGYAPDASAQRIEIFHMGGGVIPASHARELKPGDDIFVPTRVLSAKIASKSNGLDTLFKSIAGPLVLFRLLGL